MKHISLDISGANQPAKAWPAQRRYRSLFLSDVHLGAHGCRADRVLDFLERHDADVIYLVGDFLDGWRPIRSRWSTVHDEVIRTLMARSRDGARIVYVPGNHDGFFRRHYGIYFDRIEVVEQTIHVAADGKRYLVVHGDCCDVFANKARWLSLVGSHVDGAVRGLNALLNRGRRALGFEDGKLITASVATFNRLIRRWDRFEVRLSALAQSQEVEGIVCGHFHRAALHADHGVVYANCGDWLESCTAIVEEADGHLRVLDWRGRRPVAAEDPLPEAEDVPGLAI
ncbi:MAG: UDP-2,3-diacylglucosamine diphosphatase [Amaricoccus sp.]